jgi:hypothetical protein
MLSMVQRARAGRAVRWGVSVWYSGYRRERSSKEKRWGTWAERLYLFVNLYLDHVIYVHLGAISLMLIGRRLGSRLGCSTHVTLTVQWISQSCQSGLLVFCSSFAPTYTSKLCSVVNDRTVREGVVGRCDNILYPCFQARSFRRM